MRNNYHNNNNNNNFYNNNKPSYTNNKSNSNNRQHQHINIPQPFEPVSFSSGMTSEQKFHSIVENVKLSLAGRQNEDVKGCPMHPKISTKCRQCQSISKLKQIQQNKLNNAQSQQSLHLKQNKQLQPSLDFSLSQDFPQHIKPNPSNPKTYLNPKLQTSILSSSLYKSLSILKSVKQSLLLLPSQQTPLSPYIQKSQTPTIFIIILYRIFQLKPTTTQIQIMLSHNNINIKALGLIYVRFCVDYQQMFGVLKIKFNDNKLVNANWTIGEMAIKLLDDSQLEFEGIRLPRIPTKIQKAITIKLTQRNWQAKQTISALYNFNQEQISQNQKKHVKTARYRSRSRQNKIKLSQSSSSSSQSSSSSSGSQSSSIQKDKKIVKDLPPLPSITPPLSSLQQIRLNVQSSLKQTQLEEHKKRLLLEKYNAQEKINEMGGEGHETFNNNENEESEQIQKYVLK